LTARLFFDASFTLTPGGNFSEAGLPLNPRLFRFARKGTYAASQDDQARSASGLFGVKTFPVILV
jgi:hypothetical protein